jgi:hypothetical protein
MELTMLNIRPFKKIQKFDVIENDSIIHLFKITHLDHSTAVYDNDGNLVMKSTLKPVDNSTAVYDNDGDLVMKSTVKKEQVKRPKGYKTDYIFKEVK